MARVRQESGASRVRPTAGKTTAETLGREAHHILPQEFTKEFSNLGFNIHDPRFGTWVDSIPHRNWSYQYNQKWRAFLKTNPTSEQVLNFARQLAEDYGFDIYFDSY
jgi:hypothetical protein